MHGRTTPFCRLHFRTNAEVLRWFLGTERRWGRISGVRFI